MQMDRQTDRWTEGRIWTFPMILGGSSTQTPEQKPFMWHKYGGPVDQLTPCSLYVSLLHGCNIPPKRTYCTQTSHNAHIHTPQPLPTEEAFPAGAGGSSRPQTGGGSWVGTRAPTHCQGLNASWHTDNRRAPSMQSARMKITGLQTCLS